MKKRTIGYIRESIPDFEVPPYEGERYEAMVPDTLDIAERARLAIRGLTGPTDPEADHELYLETQLLERPAHHDPRLLRPRAEEIRGTAPTASDRLGVRLE